MWLDSLFVKWRVEIMRRNFEYYSLEECRAFLKATMVQGDQFYQYIHGERHEPDGALTVLKRHVQFFQGDWIGLIDFDLELGRWSTNTFYNVQTGSSTETLIAEAESFEQVARWVKAIETGEPIIINDIEDIRELLPEEYELYKRLQTQSILAVPYRNCRSGFLVVRNPQRFKDFYEALNVMAYIVTNEVIAKQRRDNVLRHTASDYPLKENQIKINLFGEMQIRGNDFKLKAEEIPSDITRKMIALLAMNQGKAFNVTMLNDRLGTDKSANAWKNLIYKFRRIWKNACCKDDEGFQLISFNGVGYQLNPELDIITDYEQADAMIKTIDDTSSNTSKEEMLKRFHALYRGEFMQQEEDDVVLIRDLRLYYKKKYLEKIIELVKLLYCKGDYMSAEKYASSALKSYSESVDMYAWTIACLRKLGRGDFAKGTIDLATKNLDTEEMELLKQKLESMASGVESEKRVKYLINNSNAITELILS